MRTSGRQPWPSQWLEQHDGRNRLLEVEASQRMTRFGRWHLANGEAVFNSVTSLRPQRIDGFWSALANSKRLDIKDAGRSNWPAIEKWLGIDRHIATKLPPEQSPFDYTWNDVEFDHRFVEIYTEHGGGRFGVDCGRVHDEEPVPRL